MLRELFGPDLVDVMDISQEVAKKTYDLVVPCYTRDGHIELGTLQAALDTLDAERGSKATIDAGELYDFRLVG